MVKGTEFARYQLHFKVENNVLYSICHLFLHIIFGMPPVLDYFIQPLRISMGITYHK